MLGALHRPAGLYGKLTSTLRGTWGWEKGLQGVFGTVELEGEVFGRYE